MRRREFVIMASAGMAALPLAARAQRSAMPVIGFLHAGSREENTKRLAAFLKGLGEGGFVDGHNVTIDYRWAAGRSDALPALAADLVRRGVVMIVTPASTAAARVAEQATTTIPIVFAIGADPVELGLAKSLSRPGGNATGITSLNTEVGAKRLGLLRELAPQAVRYFALANPTSPLAEPFVKEIESGAASLGIKLEILRASNDAELEARFAALPEGPGKVMVLGPDAFFYTRREKIAALALRHLVPAIFDDRAYVEAGGLVNYGADWMNLMQLTGGYAARVLRGEKPSDLPIQQATKFEMVINLKTAKELGLSVPQKLLLLADDVVE
jgi:putative tryptophan/tyrosine transport system substrate-binding protein